MKIKIIDLLSNHTVVFELGEIHRKLPELHLSLDQRFLTTYRLFIVNGHRDAASIDLSPEEMNVFIDVIKRLA